MSGTPKHDRHVSESDTSSSGGGGSFYSKPRGSRLARRARSFKDDFLEILSQMRSPGGGSGGGIRSGSPQSPKTRTPIKTTRSDAGDGGGNERNPLQDLDAHVRQVQFALKHFKDVVSNNKLEVLPGNGTVVLETVTTIHSALKTCLLNEQSSLLVSATNQVYQSLAQLIKLCDDVLLNGGKSINKDHVAEVIQQVEEAVQNLVALAREKLANRNTTVKQNQTRPSALDRTSSYSMAGIELPQRSSLPDIPLTPRERQILEQTSQSVIERHHQNHNHHRQHTNYSQSSDSVLLDMGDAGTPPPKPPLPGGRTWCLSEGGSSSPSGDPPPLPPKRRQRPSDPSGSGDEPGRGLTGALEVLSFRSKSPEDTSSLLSASAGSLDSVLNHSRDEEEELRVLMDPEPDNDSVIAGESLLMLSSGSSGLRTAVNGSGSPCYCRDSPDHGGNVTLGTASHQLSSSQAESGFASMHSLRSSSHSYSASASSHHKTSQQSSMSMSSHGKASMIATTTATSVVSQSQRTVSLSSSSSSSTARHTFTPLEDDGFLAPIGMDESALERLSPSSNSSTPPALPQKVRGSRRERLPSQYDNVPSSDTTDSSGLELMSVESPASLTSPQCQHRLAGCSLRSGQTSSTVIQSQSHSTLQVSSTSPLMQSTPVHKSTTTLTGPSSDSTKPPPLPLKKKHMFQSVAYSVMAYMEMFGNCSHTNNNDFLRHSVHTYNLLHSEWQQQESTFNSIQSRSFYHQRDSISKSPPLDLTSSVPPALPPKRCRALGARSISSPPASSPPPSLPPALQDDVRKHQQTRLDLSLKPSSPVGNQSYSTFSSSPSSVEQAQTQNNWQNDVGSKTPTNSSEDVGNPLDELDISRYLVIKKADEDGPDVRGGHEDGLVVHATKANKNEENETDFLYQEAFLTTYRTFLSPLELIQKLCYRHQRFHCASEVAKQRAAKESFSLLVRVVSDLTTSDLNDVILQTLMNFVYQLLCSGDLIMAKALRVKIIEKHNTKTLYNSSNPLLPSQNVYMRCRQASLLDFKSEQIAEQMTLLDAQLFMKIEIPEVLIWAQEQNEERSPNLTRFTEHFNKMSYWARSRILEQSEAKDRERYVVKFIKIMKHLRKMNNFNSYLALLSALDSAPIRRLEWQKHITEGLKEYCALIDSSSSFRAYRQALAETNPPCIPYIGLVLQDLTFVHIGNSDLLTDGTINFSKRWQQFNIVENMKRFKKGTYCFKKQDRIIAFFNNFDEFLSEEAMWQISESIKPRGGKKNVVST